MKPIDWTNHALQNLAIVKFIEPKLNKPFAILNSPYLIHAIQQEMLLRVVVAETDDEIVVVTLYKTSQIDRYLRGLIP